MDAPSTNHFDLPDWVDYVRRAGPPDRLAAMAQHLHGDRCERCSRLAQMLETAYGAARELSAVDVPEPVVRRARAIFARPPRPSWFDLPSVLAKPIGLTPQLAGVRSAGAPRHGVYLAGAVRVLLLKETRDDGGLALVGAVSNATKNQVWRDCPVALVGGTEILAETKTSRYGEFYMEVPAGRKVRLVVAPPGVHERVEVEIQP